MKTKIKVLLSVIVIGLAMFLVGVAECQRTSDLSCGIEDSNVIMALGSVILLISSAIFMLAIILKVFTEDGKSTLAIILCYGYTFIVSALIVLLMGMIIEISFPNSAEPVYKRIVWITSNLFTNPFFWSITTIMEALLTLFFIFRIKKPEIKN